MLSLSKVYVRIGISVISLALTGLGAWILYSFPPDPDILNRFQTGLHYPYPLIIMACIGAELLFLYQLWKVQGN